MDNPGYIGLTRMRGLEDELRVVANNIANVSTTGYRAEGLVFAEVLKAAEVDGGALAMAAPRARHTDQSAGGASRTGGALDLAIQGEGYFMVETPEGPRLTRAGAFTLSAEGEMVTLGQGWRVLDEAGQPIALPPGPDPTIGEDGTIAQGDQPVARVGLFAAPPESLLRQDGVAFRFEGDPEPDPRSRVLQGYLEQSNVDPVSELARMVEVQRAYELGQSFLDIENRRLTSAVQTLGRSS